MITRKRVFSLLLCICLVIGGTLSGWATEASTFIDTEVHWAKEYIDYVVSRGWFEGTSATKFEPESYLTRGMYVTILAKYAGAEITSTETHFTDVDENAYYAGSVAWANGLGLVSGVDDSHFAPERPVTRQEVIFVLYQYAQYMGYDTSGRVELRDYFVDSGIRQEYAKESLQWAVYNKLLSSAFKLGPGQLCATSEVTRAETAVIFKLFEERIVD